MKLWRTRHMDILQEALSSLGESKGLQAVVAILLAIVAGKILDWILCRVVSRACQRTRTKIDDQILKISHRPIFFTVVLIGLAYALMIGAPEGRPREIASAILKSLVVLIWITYAMRLSKVLLKWLCEQQDRYEFIQPGTVTLFDNLCRVVLVLGGAYCLFLSWDIDVTGWLASAGIVGIAVGFAAKDTLANLFAGVFILADAPYKHGDFVVLDGGDRGRVTHIGIRSTRLLTRDDIEITIPNATMGNAKITNESGGPHQKERIRITIQVAYGSDIDQVRKVLLDTAAALSGVCSDPAPRVRFRAFDESGLRLQLLCWIDEPVLRGRVIDALNTAIYKKFGEEGIEIPYARRVVYLHRAPRDAPEELLGSS